MCKFKYFVTFSLLSIFLLFMQVSVSADFDVSAKSAVLMEASTGQIIFEKNAENPIPPASITKLMTLTLAFEALEEGKVKWDDEVIVSEAAWKMTGSKMFLNVGQKVKFGDLVTGISVDSANDGCIAVAEHLYGSESAFVEAMNKRAQSLGLANTHFENPTGLPQEGHRMSAIDIAVLSQHLINKYPRILEIESQKVFTFNNIKQYNRNPLLGRFLGADGLKTGWTDEAGYCLVGTAKQNGVRLIGVILNTQNEKERLTAAQELLNYGFHNFQFIVVANAGDIVGRIPVRDGKKIDLPVKAQKQISVVIPYGRNKNDLKSEVVSTGIIKAPVASGAPVAALEVQMDGKILNRVELAAAENDPTANWFIRLWRAILRLFFAKL